MKGNREMRFSWQPGPLEFTGQVVYLQQESALNFRPRRGVAGSIVIETLELELREDTRYFCQMSGYHPHTSWQDYPVMPPPAQRGYLILEDEILSDGSSLYTLMDEYEAVGFKEVLEWRSWYNRQTGWLRMGETAEDGEGDVVEFASDCLALVDDHQLKALWLKPLLIEGPFWLPDPAELSRPTRYEDIPS